MKLVLRLTGAMNDMTTRTLSFTPFFRYDLEGSSHRNRINGNCKTVSFSVASMGYNANTFNLTVLSFTPG